MAALRDAGWDVAVIDNLRTGFRYAIPDDVAFYEDGIENKALKTQIFSERGIGAIMHFAGSIIVTESVEKPLNYYRNNTVNSHGLVTTAIAAGIRHFIFSSTAVVCGNPTAIPIGETHPTAPINPYGRSKLMTEMMLADTAEAHDFNFCALRYFNVAGADPDLRTGQSTAGATHLIEVAVEAALGKRDYVAVYGTDYDAADGTGVRGEPSALVSENASILRELKWQPRYDDLETIIRHALAWERKLSEMRTGR